MAKILSIAELKNMTLEDLGREIAEQRRTVAALRLAVSLGKEKGTHLPRRAGKLLARMCTIEGELRRAARRT